MSTSHPVVSTPAGEDAHSRAVIRDLFERTYSKGELSDVDELVSPVMTLTSTEVRDAYRGPEGLRAHVIRLRRAFHGFTVEIDDVDVVDDSFEVGWTARGTHERRYLGVDPTCTIGRAGEEPHGSRIAVAGVARGTIECGEIRELSMEWDLGALHRQLDRDGSHRGR